MNKQSFIRQHGFKKIGSYSLDPETNQVQVQALVRVSDPVSITYAMFVDGVCKYIGKTISRYERPLTYHRNNVMTRVRDGIFKEVLENGKVVEIYAKKDNLTLLHEGLQLDLAEAVEAALIKKIKPEWNSWGKKKAKKATS
jgi:hypothetical protein